MTSDVILTVPELTGHRAAARRVTAHLIGVASGRTVTVDATNCRACTQGFCDELVTELFERQRVAALVVEGGTEYLVRYVSDAATDHGVAPQVSFR